MLQDFYTQVSFCLGHLDFAITTVSKESFSAVTVIYFKQPDMEFRNS